MHISKRIQAIVDMVSPGYSVCDVGCDHAYTSITLVENGKCPYAVASDVRPGPLAAAQKNIDLRTACPAMCTACFRREKRRL